MNLILYPGLCFMLRYCGNVPLCFCVPAFPFSPVANPTTFPQHAFYMVVCWVELKIPVFGCATFHSPKLSLKFCCAEPPQRRCSVSLKFIDCMSSKKIKKCIWTICLCVALLLYTNLLKYCSAVLCAQPVIVFGATHRSFSGIAVNIQMKWCYCRLCIHMFLPSSLVWMA